MSATSLLWRALTVAVVLAAAVFLLIDKPLRLGLDLRGGTQIVLEAQSPSGRVDDDTVQRTVEVLRRRVDALGVTEPTLQRSGAERIIVELPGVTDPDEALAVIGQTAQLTFHPVVGPADAGTAAPFDPAQESVLPDETGMALRLGPAALTGDAVEGARAIPDPALGAFWDVQVDFRGSQSAEAWAQLTGQAACAAPGDDARRVAIVLDASIISSPQVVAETPCGQGMAGGSTVITGRFAAEEAKELALLLRAGALPVPVAVIQQSTIGPTLGAAAITSSVQAAIIGTALTMLFMAAAYRLLGAVAALALLVYGVLALAALVGLGATLTLPGIAGFVLAIGMAVDANVLVFERAKEEFTVTGRRATGAVRTGFKKAWTAIIDSNVTTLLAAALLIWLGSGPVRGFGVTLSIGVVVSMFSALVVTRLLADTLLASPLSGRPVALGLSAWRGLQTWLEGRTLNLAARSRRLLTLAAIVVVLAGVGMAVRGVTYGLEFSGGRLVEYTASRPVDVDALRADLAGRGISRAVVQTTGSDGVAVRVPNLSDAQQTALDDAVAAHGEDVRIVRDEFVGPTIGGELRRNAVLALGLALVVQLAYLAMRFRWTYGAAAVLAMFHDVAVLLGVFVWLGKQFDGVFLAALLTVIGYSINDTVVIFDRVRERRKAEPRRSLGDIADEACLQTLPRTVNTGMGALFILVALWALGGETLADFALALIIGTVVGMYSSVFIAVPLLILLERSSPTEERGDHIKGRRTRPAGRATATMLLLSIVFAAGCDEPGHVVSVTLVNPGPYHANVYLIGDEGRRLPLGHVLGGGERTIMEVLDQGDEWRFAFVHVEHEETHTVTREALEQAGWRVSVPAEFAEQLRAERVPTPAQRGDPAAGSSGGSG